MRRVHARNLPPRPSLFEPPFALIPDCRSFSRISRGRIAPGKIGLRPDLPQAEKPEGVQIGYLAAPLGRYVVLSVADESCGISEDVLRHLFEPFVEAIVCHAVMACDRPLLQKPFSPERTHNKILEVLGH